MPRPVLTTLTALKTHLGVSAEDVSQDSQLDQWLVQAEQIVIGATGRRYVADRNPFEAGEATEYYSGTGMQVLALNRRPLVGVPSSVRVDPAGAFGHGPAAFAASTEWALGTAYAPVSRERTEHNGAMLMALQGTWPTGYGNIRVTYAAGYTQVPDDLAAACHLIVGQLRQAAQRGGPVESETLGRYSYTLATDTSQVGVSVRGILGRYLDL
jgi:hypothetical protein